MNSIVTFSLWVTHLLVLSVHWCEFMREMGGLRQQKAIHFSDVKYVLGVGQLCHLSNDCDCAAFFLHWALAGAPPVWGKADGLHGQQPAELVGSTSDTPSCHADMISKPIHNRCSSFCHFACVAQMDSAQIHKSAPEPAGDSIGIFQLCAHCFHNASLR